MSEKQPKPLAVLLAKERIIQQTVTDRRNLIDRIEPLEAEQAPHEGESLEASLRLGKLRRVRNRAEASINRLGESMNQLGEEMVIYNDAATQRAKLHQAELAEIIRQQRQLERVADQLKRGTVSKHTRQLERQREELTTIGQQDPYILYGQRVLAEQPSEATGQSDEAVQGTQRQARKNDGDKFGTKDKKREKILVAVGSDKVVTVTTEKQRAALLGWLKAAAAGRGLTDAEIELAARGVDIDLAHAAESSNNRGLSSNGMPMRMRLAQLLTLAGYAIVEIGSGKHGDPVKRLPRELNPKPKKAGSSDHTGDEKRPPADLKAGSAGVAFEAGQVEGRKSEDAGNAAYTVEQVAALHANDTISPLRMASLINGVMAFPGLQEVISHVPEMQTAMRQIHALANATELPDNTRVDAVQQRIDVLIEMAKLRSAQKEEREAQIAALHPAVQEMVRGLNEEHYGMFLGYVREFYYGKDVQDAKYGFARSPLVTLYPNLIANGKGRAQGGNDGMPDAVLLIEQGGKGYDRKIRETLQRMIEETIGEFNEHEAEVGISGAALRTKLEWARRLGQEDFAQAAKRGLLSIDKKGNNWLTRRYRLADVVALRYFNEGPIADKLKGKLEPRIIVTQLSQITVEEVSKFMQQRQQAAT